jgi:CBS domain-containing protein
MKISDVMTRDIRLSHPNDTLEQAAQLMAQIDAGALLVADSDRLVGVITDRDIAVRGAAKGKDPRTASVRDAMSGEVKYCFEDQEIDEVTRNMGEQQIRRLAVLNRDKRLVGVVSLGDIAIQAGGAKGGEALEGISQPGGQHSQSEQAYAAEKPTGKI